MKDLITAAKVTYYLIILTNIFQANKEHFRRLEHKVDSHENSEHVIQIVAKDLD